MAFLQVFERYNKSYDTPSLNPFTFREKIMPLHVVHVSIAWIIIIYLLNFEIYFILH